MYFGESQQRGVWGPCRLVVGQCHERWMACEDDRDAASHEQGGERGGDPLVVVMGAHPPQSMHPVAIAPYHRNYNNDYDMVVVSCRDRWSQPRWWGLKRWSGLGPSVEQANLGSLHNNNRSRASR